MVDEHHARSGSVIAMDPRTGDVLRLRQLPDLRSQPAAQVIATYPLARIWRSRAPYEPGSVFKVITLSAALETTRLRPETMINCGGGKITLFGRTIHDDHRYGMLSMEDVLARSSNIGAINIGLTVGQEKLYDYVRRFGFGQQNRNRRCLASPPAWSGRSSAGRKPPSLRSRWVTRSASRRIQLAQACSIIASGGLRVSPRLTLDAPSHPAVRVIKPETAITMRRMMEGVMIKPYGTGHHYARLIGYTSGGKTGTAMIYDYQTHHYTHFYNASFVGIRAGCESGHRGRGHHQPHRRPGRLWRSNLGARVSRSDHRRAAHQGCAQGFARDASVRGRRSGR